MNIFTVLNVATWARFKEHRKQLKKPMTGQAERNMLKKLMRMVVEGQDVNAVVEQSIERNWQGIFNVKTEDGTASDYIRDRNARGLVLDVPTRAEERTERQRQRRLDHPGGELAERVQEGRSKR